MSNDAGGFGQPGGPPPHYPPTGYPPPAYGYYPPPGYQGYPPPGYQGYPPPGYPPPGYPPPYSAGPPMPPALKPGVIPLRPLTLTDILNGAVAYIRANPKAALGLTTVVVVVAQIVSLALQIGPLAATGELGVLRGEDPSTAAALGSSASSLASALTTLLSSILLSGMLTVIVGRAVFGAGISIEEAWRRVRGRLLALLGFTVLWVVALLLLIAVVVFIVAFVAAVANGASAVALGIPLGLATIALLVYLWTALSFAPPLIVLERLGVFAAIARSIKLIRSDFWRVLGIKLLATIVAGVVAGAVSIPFSVTGQILLLNTESTTTTLVALGLVAIGGAIGQIITAPFGAGVVVLLYADRRIRAEAFDLVLQTGAAIAPGAAPDSTDHLWLTRQP